MASFNAIRVTAARWAALSPKPADTIAFVQAGENRCDVYVTDNAATPNAYLVISTDADTAAAASEQARIESEAAKTLAEAAKQAAEAARDGAQAAQAASENSADAVANTATTVAGLASSAQSAELAALAAKEDAEAARDQSEASLAALVAAGMTIRNTNLMLYIAPDANSASPGDYIGPAGLAEAIAEAQKYLFVNSMRAILTIRNGVYIDMPTLQIQHPQPGVIDIRAATPSVNTKYADMTDDEAADKALVVSRYSVVFDYTINRTMVNIAPGSGAIFRDILFRSSNGAQMTNGVNFSGGGRLELIKCGMIEIGGQIMVGVGVSLGLTACFFGFKPNTNNGLNLSSSDILLGSSAANETLFAHIQGTALLLSNSRLSGNYSTYWRVQRAALGYGSYMELAYAKWRCRPGSGSNFLTNFGGYINAPIITLDSVGATAFPITTSFSGSLSAAGITLPTAAQEPNATARTITANNGSWQSVTASVGDLVRSPASGTFGNSGAYSN